MFVRFVESIFNTLVNYNCFLMESMNQSSLYSHQYSLETAKIINDFHFGILFSLALCQFNKHWIDKTAFCGDKFASLNWDADVKYLYFKILQIAHKCQHTQSQDAFFASLLCFSAPPFVSLDVSTASCALHCQRNEYIYQVKLIFNYRDSRFIALTLTNQRWQTVTAAIMGAASTWWLLQSAYIRLKLNSK